MEALLSQRELAERLGVSPRLIRRRWSGNGGTFPPDTRIGTVLGWSPERARRFGDAAGLLDADGNALRVPLEQERVAEPPGDWTVDTRVLLGLTDISELWGRSLPLVLRQRRVPGFPGAVARIGSGPHDVYGWTLDDVVAYGRQKGTLDEAGRPTPKRSHDTRTLA